MDQPFFPIKVIKSSRARWLNSHVKVNKTRTAVGSWAVNFLQKLSSPTGMGPSLGYACRQGKVSVSFKTFQENLDALRVFICFKVIDSRGANPFKKGKARRKIRVGTSWVQIQVPAEGFSQTFVKVCLSNNQVVKFVHSIIV